MTHDEAKMIFECEIRTRWMKWKPSDQMVEDMIFAIKPYDNPEDVRNGIKKYSNGFRGTTPRVDDILAKVNEAIGERRKLERKEKGEWPGQVFVVIHHAADGSEDGIWHFHVPNESQQVPYEWQSRRLEGHIHFCTVRFSDRYPAGGHFTGEVHNEESFSKRFREYSLSVSGPEVKARRAEVEERLFNGEDPKRVLQSMFKVIEEKAKVPFHPRGRAKPTLPQIELPFPRAEIPRQGDDDVPPFLAEEPGELIHDDPSEPEQEKPVIHKVPFVKAPWLDQDLNF